MANDQNHRVAAGDVDFSFRVGGNSACIAVLYGRLNREWLLLHRYVVRLLSQDRIH